MAASASDIAATAVNSWADLPDVVVSADGVASLPKNPEKAQRFYEIAIAQGHAAAMHALASMYEDGRDPHMPANLAVALIQYAKAAAAGSEMARDRVMSLTNAKMAETLIKAVSGDVEAIYQVANKFDEGEDNLPKNHSTALEWYLMALEKGSAAAANNLGVLYDNGKGVERDASKAVEYFTKSAELGSQWAMKNLGIIYEYGRDGVVIRNISKAVSWYTKAAEKGNEQAQQALRRIKAGTAT
jgi:TPR repeat protein